MNQARKGRHPSAKSISSLPANGFLFLLSLRLHFQAPDLWFVLAASHSSSDPLLPAPTPLCYLPIREPFPMSHSPNQTMLPPLLLPLATRPPRGASSSSAPSKMASIKAFTRCGFAANHFIDQKSKSFAIRNYFRRPVCLAGDSCGEGWSEFCEEVSQKWTFCGALFAGNGRNPE